MLTQSDLNEALDLISKARIFVAKMDRNASATEVHRVNQTFAHLEKAELYITRLKNKDK